MMYKCLEQGNQYEALLELRNTPRQDTGLSPSQMMFGRLTRSRLPAVTNREVSKKQVKQGGRRRRARKMTVKRSYDKRAKDLVPLCAGQPVFYQHLPGQQWKRGTVRSREGERSYIIQGDNGGVYQRNRVHMRPTCVPKTPLRTTYVPDNPPQDTHPDLSQRPHVHPTHDAVLATPQICNDGNDDDRWLTAEPEVSADDSRAPVTTPRPQRTRKKPSWMLEFETDF